MKRAAILVLVLAAILAAPSALLADDETLGTVGSVTTAPTQDTQPADEPAVTVTERPARAEAKIVNNYYGSRPNGRVRTIVRPVYRTRTRTRTVVREKPVIVRVPVSQKPAAPVNVFNFVNPTPTQPANSAPATPAERREPMNPWLPVWIIGIIAVVGGLLGIIALQNARHGDEGRTRREELRTERAERAQQIATAVINRNANEDKEMTANMSGGGFTTSIKRDRKAPSPPPTYILPADWAAPGPIHPAPPPAPGPAPAGGRIAGAAARGGGAPGP